MSDTELIIYFVSVFVYCCSYYLVVKLINNAKMKNDVTKNGLFEVILRVVFVLSMVVILVEPVFFFYKYWKTVVLVSVAIIMATLEIEPVDKNQHWWSFYVVRYVFAAQLFVITLVFLWKIYILFMFIFWFLIMDLEKLFGSKTKVDILKYLLFRRQWVSMRALEWELEWTFPAIKKQVDSLKSAEILKVDTDWNWWSISVEPWIHDLLKQIFYYWLKWKLVSLFESYDVMIDKYFFWKCFWVNLDMDLVVIYKNMEKPQIEKLKESISDIFRWYFIEVVNVVFMSCDERDKRYRLADRFVLDILRNSKTVYNK